VSRGENTHKPRPNPEGKTIAPSVWLPMALVMQDRNRRTYFGTRTPWERWLAYTQSTSLCRYLIERYGKELFVQLYDVPVELVAFERLYGKPIEMLVDEWLSY